MAYLVHWGEEPVFFESHWPEHSYLMVARVLPAAVLVIVGVASKSAPKHRKAEPSVSIATNIAFASYVICPAHALVNSIQSEFDES